MAGNPFIDKTILLESRHIAPAPEWREGHPSLTVPVFDRVPAGRLVANPWNPNKMTAFMYDKAVESLQEFGFIAPVIVRRLGDRFQIIDGEHRYRAALSLGIAEIPVVIVDDLTEPQAKKLTVVLNELHGQLDPGKLSDLLGELMDSSSVESVLQSMPFTSDILKGFVGLDGVPLPKPVKQERGKRADRWTERTFRMPAPVDDVVGEALARARENLANDDGRPVEDWQALEVVCAEYLAGNG